MNNQSNQLFAAALGIGSPWSVTAVDFDASQRRLTIHVDFAPGTRFAHPRAAGEHPVHDTEIKRLRHLNFFQHECHLEVRVPRLRLPDGKVALIEPDWVGKLKGFTLLFEALVLMLAQQMGKYVLDNGIAVSQEKNRQASDGTLDGIYAFEVLRPVIGDAAAAEFLLIDYRLLSDNQGEN
jgi:hypothetical protein